MAKNIIHVNQNYADVQQFCYDNDSWSKQPKMVSKRKHNSLPQIALKKVGSQSQEVLLNCNWDTTNKIPNIVAEMHNVKTERDQSTWDMADVFSSEMTSSCETESLIDFQSNVPSPRGSDSGLGNDSPDGNLLWLLNYKLNDILNIPESTEEPQRKYTPRKIAEAPNNNKNGSTTSACIGQNQPNDATQYNLDDFIQLYPSNKSSASINDTRKKPPFTYTELIEHALREKGELTVSGIYQWISDHFSFYKVNDDRWKNSVRHNLSINPQFRKGGKAVTGAGHLWTIAAKDDPKTESTWKVRRQRMENFLGSDTYKANELFNQEIELANATASILPNGRIQQTAVQTNDPQREINQAANDILNGVKHQVEVQYITLDNTLGMDFLCPVSKEQVAEECGLTGEDIQIHNDNDFLITDINPTTLGLNMTETEIITTDQLFSNELNFQCYDLSTE